MAYGIRYILIGQNKGGYTITCNIYDESGSGSDTFRVDYQPFEHNVLAQDDDVFYPIISSELIVKANITDFSGTLPDFTTNNDRKYYAVLKATKESDDWELFKGFILTDNVTLNFSTGFQSLQFSITDGLAMLKNIPYVPTNPDINVLEDLRTTILNCLNKIGLPFTYYLNICTSIFATGMNDRGTGLQYEPLSQCYKYPRDWQNSPSRTIVGVEPTSTYINCYDVLQKLALSWGCHIKQSGGEYYFASISEQAGAAGTTIYYTRVDNTGSLISYGSLDPKRTINHYSTSNNIYFIDNKQTKTLRKGFPDLQLTCAAAYAPQFIYGGTMATFTGGVPDQWTFTPSTGNVTATCSQNTYGFYTGAELFAGTNYCDLIANCPVKLWAGKINLSFVLKPLSYIANTPGCQVEIKIDVGGGHHWKYKKDAGLQDAVWVYDYVDGFYNVDVSSNELTTQTITTTDIPTQGTLSVKFRIQNATTSSGAFIAYCILTLSDPYDYRLIKNTTSNPAYRKVIELPIGGPSEYRNYSQIGSLLKSDGTQWTGWYRYGVTESRDELMYLVYQNYYNIVSKASINMYGNVWGLFQSGIRPTQPFTAFNVVDTGGKISVNNKCYLIGNSTFDYIDNTVSATLLETSNTDLSATITDTTIFKL